MLKQVAQRKERERLQKSVHPRLDPAAKQRLSQVPSRFNLNPLGDMLAHPGYVQFIRMQIYNGRHPRPIHTPKRPTNRATGNQPKIAASCYGPVPAHQPNRRRRHSKSPQPGQRCTPRGASGMPYLGCRIGNTLELYLNPRSDRMAPAQRVSSTMLKAGAR